MRTINISDEGIKVGGDLADLSSLSHRDKEEFFKGILLMDVSFSDNLILKDLIEVFSGAEELIKDLFSEEYRAVTAFVNSAVLSKRISTLKLFKSFKIEDELSDEGEFLNLMPEIEFINSDELGYVQPFLVKVEIDEDIILNHSGVEIKTKTKMTLLDVMSCLFEEMPIQFKEGVIIK